MNEKDIGVIDITVGIGELLKDVIDTMRIMNLSIFNKFDSLNKIYNDVRFISGSELDILKKYDEILEVHKNEKIRNCILIHCNDMVIATPYFRNLCKRFRKDLLENPNFKIIFVSIYDYHSFFPLPTDLPNFTWVYYPEYQAIYWKIYQDDIPIHQDEEIEYYFLSLNKRIDMYRQTLCYKFYNNNWLDTSIFTYLAEKNDYTQLFDEESYYSTEKLILETNLYTDIPKTNNPLIIKKDDDILITEYRKKHIDEYLNEVNPSWKINKEWYSKTYCSLVLETDVGDNIINLSEKTFRSIMMQHPLYLFAAENTYDYLSQLNLKLLPENLLWDKGATFDRFKIFLDYLDILHNKIKNNTKQLRKENYQHSVYLRNQYYKLYKRMLQKESIIQTLILNRFEFLKEPFFELKI